MRTFRLSFKAARLFVLALVIVAVMIAIQLLATGVTRHNAGAWPKPTISAGVWPNPTGISS